MQKEISLPIKERIYQAAFVFLVLFAVMVIYNDLVKTLPVSQECRSQCGAGALARVRALPLPSAISLFSRSWFKIELHGPNPAQKNPYRLD